MDVNMTRKRQIKILIKKLGKIRVKIHNYTSTELDLYKYREINKKIARLQNRIL